MLKRIPLGNILLSTIVHNAMCVCVCERERKREMDTYIYIE